MMNRGATVAVMKDTIPMLASGYAEVCFCRNWVYEIDHIKWQMYKKEESKLLVYRRTVAAAKC